MRNFCTALIAAGMLMSAPAQTAADPKPRGAKAASSHQISRAYAGRTALWDQGCSGGIYFGGNAQARAWCADQSNNLGAGSWTVDNRGNLCYHLTWYYPNGNRAGSSRDKRTCISHVVAGGKIWRSWPNDDEWWPLAGSSDMVRGYRFQIQVRQVQGRLGI